MKKYRLFLDESIPSGNLDYFCLAGIAIEDKTYENKIVPEVKELKRSIFGNEDVIFHEMEIRNKKEKYAVLKNNIANNQLWAGIEGIFQNNDYKVFGVAIHEKNLDYLYKHSKRDRYYICLQVILENFIHFLRSVDGRGYVEIEARHAHLNEQLQDHFYSLKLLGTLFYEAKSLKNHLGTIAFPKKSDNVIGLQLADLIPNPVNRHFSGAKQKSHSIIGHIINKAYDGNGIKEMDRFGLKQIP